MKILIYGAGTIGLSYAWLLSSENNVEIFIKKEKMSLYKNGVTLSIKNLKNKETEYKNYLFYPKCTSTLDNTYDLIIITVNSMQLQNALQDLYKYKGKSIFLILQNNWNIQSALKPYFSLNDCVIGFPSSIGGGRNGTNLKVILFDAETLLGENSTGENEQTILIKNVFEASNIRSKIIKKIDEWLKVHALQQAVTSGAILEAGNYNDFVKNFLNVKKMILAWREGILLCEYLGISTKNIFPSRYLFFPTVLITLLIKFVLQQANTSDMIKGHLNSGLVEWAMQYKEILTLAENIGFSMPTWKSYNSFVTNYLKEEL